MKRDNAKNLNVSSTHTRKRTSAPRPSPPTSLGREGVKRAPTGLIPSPREERAGRGACVSASFSYSWPHESLGKRPASPTRTDQGGKRTVARVAGGTYRRLQISRA